MRDYIEVRTIRATDRLERELNALGLHNLTIKKKDAGPLGSLRILTFIVYLDDPKFPEFQQLLEEHNLVFGYATEFTEAEIETAEWFEIRSTSWLGYPKPESSWKRNTYDLTTPNYCSLCGAGLLQVNPFSLGSNQPKAKTSSFFSPGWVHDQVFVTAEVQSSFRKEGITGVDYLAPLKAKSKLSFDDLFQLIVKDNLESALVNQADFSPGSCQACGRLLYKASDRAKRYDKRAFSNAPDIVRSAEWYGNGRVSRQLIIVSHKFVDLKRAKKWRGLWMQPIVFSH